MTDIAKSITDKLAELGDSPDSIAAKLLELGIKGDRCGGASCPLAVYLGQDVPGVWVGPSEVRNGPKFGGDEETTKLAMLPAAHQDFVELFDLGRYPALDVAS